MHWQESEQDEMNERKQQALAECPQFLARYAAGKGVPGTRHEFPHSLERIWRQPHIGIDEDRLDELGLS